MVSQTRPKRFPQLPCNVLYYPHDTDTVSTRILKLYYERFKLKKFTYYFCAWLTIDYVSRVLQRPTWNLPIQTLSEYAEIPFVQNASEINTFEMGTTLQIHMISSRAMWKRYIITLLTWFRLDLCWKASNWTRGIVSYYELWYVTYLTKHPNTTFTQHSIKNILD